MANELGTTLNSLSDPMQNVVVNAENQEILAVHGTIEGVAHESGLNGSLHGLTNTGETVGLGRVGEDNLITDVAQAPGDLLNGEPATDVASGIVMDAGNSISQGGTIVSGLGGDLSNPNLINDAVDGTSGIINDVTGALPGGSGGQSGDGESLISAGIGGSGSDGTAPIVDAGLLTAAPGDAPIGLAAGSGNNIADVNLLSGDDTLSNAAAPLGGVTGGSDGSGDSLIFAGAGQAGDANLLDAGVLTAAPGSSPVGVSAIDGANLATATLLNGQQGAGSHLISAAGGADGENSLLDTGVLTTPDGQTPLNADIGNGANLATANLLGNSDALQFADLGGAGTDALTGVVAPSIAPGLDDGSGTDTPLVDLHTDGEALAQIHITDPTALAGVNDHAIV